jgi:hypothetical protein
MHATRTFLLWMSAVLLAIVSGCAAGAPPTEEVQPTASDRPARTLRVFVETFEDAPDSPGSGSMFTPVFMTALQSVAASVNARYVQTTKKDTAEGVITGRVTVWKDGSFSKQATVGFNATCVHTESGDVLWTVSDVSRPWATARENRTAEYVSGAAATHGLRLIRDQL